MQATSFKFRATGVLAAIIALGVFTAGPIGAATFASSASFASSFSFSFNPTGNVTTVSDSEDLTLNFAGSVLADLPADVQANLGDVAMSVSATSSNIGNCGVACAAGDTLTQTGFAGTVTYRLLTGPDAGDVVLMGTFTDGTANYTVGGDTGGLDASGANLAYTSPYLSFAHVNPGSEGLTVNVTGGTDFETGPVVANQAYLAPGSYVGTTSAQYSSQPLPVGNTPEPASFAMIGGGLIALGLLRRKKVSD